MKLSLRTKTVSDAGLPQTKSGAVVTQTEQQRIRDWLKKRGEPQLSQWARRRKA
jgi:hypothetical protein